MFLKFFILSAFIVAEVILGVYSLLLSESLMARFLFFVISAALICAGVIKLSQKILPQKEEKELVEE